MCLNFRFHVFFDPAELRMSVEKFLATWLCNEASLKLPFFHHWRPLESVWRWRFHPLYSCDANSMLHKFWRPNSLSSEIATMNKEDPLPVNGFRLHLVSVFHHVSWSQWFHMISYNNSIHGLLVQLSRSIPTSSACLHIILSFCSALRDFRLIQPFHRFPFESSTDITSHGMAGSFQCSTSRP